MNDITKHPLYRKHHGDMTGWRFLEKGEKINRGDEVNTLEDVFGSGWEIVKKPSWNQAFHNEHLAFRRRIAPAVEKPSDQKRYVTVIVEMNESVDLKSSLAKSELHVSEIREGNYLEKFDNRKERVLKALEGEEV